MQRRATKRSTRAANSEEKKFARWVAEQPCCECGSPRVIVDHMYGSAFIHNKVLIGHWALLPLCEMCDAIKTQGSHNAYIKEFGRTQAQAWLELVSSSQWVNKIPPEVYQSIEIYGK